MKNQIILTVLLLSILSPLIGNSQVMSRLIKQYDSSADFIDTNIYTYTGTRGCYYSNGNFTIDYDYSLRNTYPGGDGPSYFVKTYDSHGNLSSYTYADDYPIDSERSFSIYDSHRNVVDYIGQVGSGMYGPLVNQEHDSMAYDASNNRTFSLMQNWNTTLNAWEDYERHFYQYDSHNNLLVDSTQVLEYGTWTYGDVTINTYNIHNLLTTSILRIRAGYTDTGLNNTLYSYVYNDSNLLVTQTIQNYDTGGTMQNSYLDSFTYYANSDVRLSFYYTWLDGIGYVLGRRDSMGYDARHNETSDFILSMYSTAIYDTTYFIGSYNTYNQPLKQWYGASPITDTTSTFRGSGYSQYYYELYNVEKTTDVITKLYNLQLYPCPAQNFISIGLNLPNPEGIIVTITNMAGKQYRQFSETATGNYHKIVSVTGIPDGNYVLTISSADINESRQFTILH